MSAPRPTTYVVRPPRGTSKVAKQHLLVSRRAVPKANTGARSAEVTQ